MGLIKRMRRQRAVYWRKNGVDHHGKALFDDPVEITCRWVDGASEFRTMQGSSILFQGKIYVDRAMKVGDMLKRGELESSTVSDPTRDRDAYAVQRFRETPNLRNTETLYTAFV